MEVEIRLYSLIAELVGSRHIILEINNNIKIKELFNYLAGKYYGFRRAIEIIGKDNLLILDDSGRRLDENDIIRGKVIHIMPPPEGGNERLIRTGILQKNEKINLNELIAEATRSSPSTGAIAIFVGVVRADNFGKNVDRLIYEDAGELTKNKLEEIAREIMEKHDLSYIAAYHYIGDLKPGDITMIVVVGAKGRTEAFPAMEELVESMKRKLPVWKKEVYVDGSYSYILGGKPYTIKNP